MRASIHTTYDKSHIAHPNRGIPLHGLSALQILIVLGIGLGYASTMAIGMPNPEWGHHWGYDPSWFFVQLLFVFSGFLALRSLQNGRSIKDFFESRFLSLWPAFIAVTVISALIIYPLMCAGDAPVKLGFGERISYILKKVFLLDTGAKLPGLLDHAEYPCLLQGATWTLRWGLFCHIGLIIGWKVGLFRQPAILLGCALLSIALYVSLIAIGLSNEAFGDQIRPYMVGLRLGYAYISGAALFAWQKHLPNRLSSLGISAVGVGVLVTLSQTFLPWTGLIEVLGTLFWTLLCLVFLNAAPLSFKRCPRLAPMLYVSIWPAAQMMVAWAPGLTQMQMIQTSILLASLSAFAIFTMLRQAHVQPTRL